MSKYFKSGDEFRVASDNALDMHDRLPAGNYVVKNHPMTGLYLVQQSSFPIPKKLYGDTAFNAERILNTFSIRKKSTGVLLSGEKGSGKTLLAKKLSDLAANSFNIPTIVVDTPFHGSNFNKFIQDIDQPAIIFFDEFEKMYDEEKQDDILTLLDGVYPSEKLFVLTVNDEYEVSKFLFNRPGRIYYAIEFEGLGKDFIREFCEDVLEDKQHIDTICSLSSLFSAFNFDMLQALVEEMNRYHETPVDALKLLNVKPKRSSSKFEIEYSITFMDNDGTVLIPEDKGKTWWGEPLKESVHVYHKMKASKKPSTEEEEIELEEPTEHSFQPEDIITLDAINGVFKYKNSNGKLLILKKLEKSFDYTKFLA